MRYLLSRSPSKVTSCSRGHITFRRNFSAVRWTWGIISKLAWVVARVLLGRVVQQIPCRGLSALDSIYLTIVNLSAEPTPERCWEAWESIFIHLDRGQLSGRTAEP